MILEQPIGNNLFSGCYANYFIVSGAKACFRLDTLEKPIPFEFAGQPALTQHLAQA